MFHPLPVKAAGSIRSAASSPMASSSEGEDGREDTLEVLRAAFAAGCLDDEELAERAGRAYGARTREDLHSVVRDIPSELAQAERARPGPACWTPPRMLGWEYGLMLAAAGIWLRRPGDRAGGKISRVTMYLDVQRHLA